uniref:Uncharacterized protein n=1 Tax=Nelumbo nucifera TaxID=4432 RepID=A0A822XHQ1_NELNU|nr:TPA_asm: hypothetical protein HUJ06_021230 [Nelumbo nucifera]
MELFRVLETEELGDIQEKDKEGDTPSPSPLEEKGKGEEKVVFKRKSRKGKKKGCRKKGVGQDNPSDPAKKLDVLGRKRKKNLSEVERLRCEVDYDKGALGRKGR